MTDDQDTTARSNRPTSPRAEPDAPIPYCDGRGLKQLMRFGLAWLERHQAAINALNVYPVPDGDTGTNMLLTMQSAYQEIQDSPEEEVGIIAQKVAHGALMGARGNSGVILSQIFRGFARALEGVDAFDTVQFAAALREAATTAYKGVIKPVEGTILTVAREAGRRSRERRCQQRGPALCPGAGGPRSQGLGDAHALPAPGAGRGRRGGRRGPGTAHHPGGHAPLREGRSR